MPQRDPLILTLQEWIGTFMRRSMRSLILYSKENELSMSQIGALFQINRGRSNVSDLGEGLGITSAAASQMLERLVQQESDPALGRPAGPAGQTPCPDRQGPPDHAGKHPGPPGLAGRSGFHPVCESKRNRSRQQ